MTDAKFIRSVRPIRLLSLGVAAAAVGSPALSSGGAMMDGHAKAALFGPAGASVVLAAGEGESEGASRAVTEADFLAALGFMQGHLRAGLALYQAGDLAAAKTHMGHPIEEKYDAVERDLEERGFGRLEDAIKALARAAESEAPVAEVEQKYAAVDALLAEVRAASPGGEKARLKSLSLLTRIAADEYSVAVKGGTVSKLHEYQDSWGFLREVEAQADELSASSDAGVAAAAAEIGALVDGLDVAYGDIQGKGQMRMEPDLLYGAAARMELAALKAR